jgi:hypothetical protein
MGESAMMSEPKHGPFKSPEHVQVRSFRGQRHGSGRQRSFSVESRSRQNCASQKMSDWFQVKFVTQPE